jgi:hypothetical protein
MAISAQDVKKLRDFTAAENPFMEIARYFGLFSLFFFVICISLQVLCVVHVPAWGARFAKKGR